MNKELERDLRRIVVDMFALADAEMKGEVENDAVRWYRQGKADALRQWAKTIRRRLEKEKAQRQINRGQKKATSPIITHGSAGAIRRATRGDRG